MTTPAEKCVRCKDSAATERGTSVPYVGAHLCARCAAVLAQDAEVEADDFDPTTDLGFGPLPEEER